MEIHLRWFVLLQALLRLTEAAVVQNSTGYLEMNDLGCFRDLDDGTKGFLSQDSRQCESNDMTVNMCIHSCFQQGFKYAGLQSGTKCFCWNSGYNINGNASMSECMVRCAGNRHRPCGGNHTNHVYELYWVTTVVHGHGFTSSSLTTPTYTSATLVTTVLSAPSTTRNGPASIDSQISASVSSSMSTSVQPTQMSSSNLSVLTTDTDAASNTDHSIPKNNMTATMKKINEQASSRMSTATKIQSLPANQSRTYGSTITFDQSSTPLQTDLVAEGNESTVEPSLHQDEQRDSDTGLFTGIGVGAGILAILIIILLVYLFLLIRRKRSSRMRKSDNVELRVFDEAGAQYPSFCRNHVLHEKNRRSIMSEEMLYSFLSTRNSEVPTTSRNASRYSSSTNYENSKNNNQMYMNISYKQQEPSLQPGNTGSNHQVPTIEISQQTAHTKNRTPNNNIHELQTENCTSMVENELYG